MIKSLTYEILKKVWHDNELTGSIYDQLVEVAVREGEQRQADRIEALEAALRDLVEAVQRRATDLGGYDGRFGLNKTMSKACAALAGDSLHNSTGEQDND